MKKRRKHYPKEMVSPPETMPGPLLTPRGRRIALRLGLVLVLVMSYALELDVALGLGAGQVTGRIAWFDDRGARSAYGHLRAKGSWPILVVTNERGVPVHYFHSFVPGVYRELFDVIQARQDAEADNGYSASDPVVATRVSTITRQSHPPSRAPHGRIKYAGLGRKSVYAFEELPSPP